MTEELRALFYERLNLNLLSFEMQEYFLKVMNNYMKHGRTYEYVESTLDRLLNFFEAIGIGNMECAIILMNFPTILNIVDELYEKYLFLGILENEDNTFRRHKFFSKTKDYRTCLNTIYARYKLCMECGYEDIKWNTLVHATDTEFAKIFVYSTYRKPYQRFTTVQEVNKYMETIDVSDLNIDRFKELPVNREIVEKYEGKRRTM